MVWYYMPADRHLLQAIRIIAYYEQHHIGTTVLYMDYKKSII